MGGVILILSFCPKEKIVLDLIDFRVSFTLTTLYIYKSTLELINL